jgi:hypothetical protein
VPAHASGQVVDAEKVLQFLRLGRAAFHPVQQGQLAVQQGLAPAGQVPEHVADAAAQASLVNGGLDRGLADDAEGVLDLLDLVLGRVLLGSGIVGHVHRLAVTQLVDHFGQLLIGEAERRLAQTAQLADEAAADVQR